MAAREPVREWIDGVDRPVRVTESARRKKSISAQISDTDGVLEVRVPVGLDTRVRNEHIRELAIRLERKRSSSHIDLADRAKTLAKRYDLRVPTSIEWSDRQNKRWGSCSPATGAVRISNRLAELPPWVLDYVIIHELAHLEELNHNKEFHDIVNRYPRAERAEGFLEAVSMGLARSAEGMSW